MTPTITILSIIGIFTIILFFVDRKASLNARNLEKIIKKIKNLEDNLEKEIKEMLHKAILQEMEFLNKKVKGKPDVN